MHKDSFKSKDLLQVFNLISRFNQEILFDFTKVRYIGIFFSLFFN